ncbi:hypothetical protein [Komagataeibacter sp. FNDCF1]|nr:hypothetical protein [Komagataeibacter sp. FNDCF1]
MTAGTYHPAQLVDNLAAMMITLLPERPVTLDRVHTLPPEYP